MNEKSKRNIILIIIAVFVIATGLISLAMYNITKSSGKKNSKNTTATMSDAGSITTEVETTEAEKDSKTTTEQATTTEEVKDSKATTEAVASGSSKKDESNSNSKPSSSSNSNSNSGSASGGNSNSENQKPSNSSTGSNSNSNNSSSSSGSGSTNPSSGNSSNSNSSNSGNNSSSSSGSGNNNSQSSCSHNWVQVFIHHDQVKHTEYYTTTEIIGYHSFCRGCNLDLTATYGGINDAAESHLLNCRDGAGASYEGRPIYQEKQVPYDVIDQEAYDEPAGYKCSICGATK